MKENLRMSVMYAYVNMHNTTSSISDRMLREQEFNHLRKKWKDRYGNDDWFKPCYVAMFCDYSGWSDGFMICSTEEEAKNVTDKCNAKASPTHQTAYYYPLETADQSGI